MSKHTPGPWLVSRSIDKRTATHVRTEAKLPGASDGVSVCRITYVDDRAAANACLIAAAPDMLEALEAVTNTDDHAAPEVRAIVRAALRKARGE